MRPNPQRRDLLIDTAIILLAEKGEAGLSYRNLDQAAQLPTGTASNYFRNRNELIQETVARIHTRLSPDPAWLEQTLATLQGKELQLALLTNLVERVQAQQAAYTALLEIRILARRQPELRGHLLPVVRQNLQLSEQGQPGVSTESSLEFLLTYLTISGLLFEELTLPGILHPWSAQQIIQAKLQE